MHVQMAVLNTSMQTLPMNDKVLDKPLHAREKKLSFSDWPNERGTTRRPDSHWLPCCTCSEEGLFVNEPTKDRMLPPEAK